MEERGRGELTKEEYKVMLAANDQAIHACEADIAAAQSAYVATTLPAMSRLCCSAARPKPAQDSWCGRTRADSCSGVGQVSGHRRQGPRAGARGSSKSA